MIMKALFLLLAISLTSILYSQEFPEFITKLFLADSIGTLDKVSDFHIENAIQASVDWNVGNPEHLTFEHKCVYPYHYFVNNVDCEISKIIKYDGGIIGYYVQTKDLVLNLGYMDHFISKGGNVLLTVYGEPTDGYQKSYWIVYNQHILPLEYQVDLIAKSETGMYFDLAD